VLPRRCSRLLCNRLRSLTTRFSPAGKPAALACDLRVHLKPEIDLPEMIVARENARDAEFLHDHDAGEIDEGDIRFVLIFLAHVPGTAKLRR
jgi:hypothetical protein